MSNAGEGETGGDLRDLLLTLRARWPVVAISTGAALGVAFLYLLTATSIYTASVSILIDPRVRTAPGADSQQAQTGPDAILIESQGKLIASDAILRRVAQKEGLADDPDFVSVSPGLRTRLFSALGFSRPVVPSLNERLTAAVLGLQRMIVVKRSERTYVLDVEVSSANPVKAARLADAVAEAYLADQHDARMELIRRDAASLNQRVEELQGRLQSAENRVLDFKIRHRMVDANGKDVLEQQLAELTTELGRVRARTVEAQSRQEQIQKVIASGRNIEALADSFKSATLDRLRAQLADITRQEASLRTTLADRHPALLEVQTQLRDTRRQIDGELRRLASVAAGELSVARAAETETLARVDGVRGELEARSQSALELRDLQREVDASRAVYERFLRAREGISAEGSESLVARVIAPAVTPSAPSAPKRMAVLFIALSAGLLFGAGLALLLDYLQIAKAPQPSSPAPAGFEPPPGRRPRPLTGVRQIPLGNARSGVIGRFLLSRFAARAQERRALERVLHEPSSPFTRAIYDLLRDVGTDMRAGVPCSVLITSDARSPERTLIASNLALLAAASGLRTLLIDADPQGDRLPALTEGETPAGVLRMGGAQRAFYHHPRLGPDLAVAPVESGATNGSAGANQKSLDDFDLVIMHGPRGGKESAALAISADRVIVVSPRAKQVDALITLLADRFDVPAARLVGAWVRPADAGDLAA